MSMKLLLNARFELLACVALGLFVQAGCRQDTAATDAQAAEEQIVDLHPEGDEQESDGDRCRGADPCASGRATLR